MLYSRVSRLSPGRIALGYAVIAILWIAFSDAVVTHLKVHPAVMTIKGTVFVLVTASLLYFTVRRLVRSVQLTSQERDETARLYRTVVEASKEGICLLDESGRISFLNRPLAAMLGRPAEELQGKWLQDFIEEPHVLAERSAQQSETYECRLRTDSDRKPWVLFSRRPVLNDAGEVVQWVGTVIDITERKRAEEEHERLHQLEADLAHINRISMMGELAASIAHEVNQPLSGVVSNAGACLRWLAREAPNVEEAREAVHRIVRDGKRAGEVIARIRALTRKDATPREKLDLNEIIREVLVLAGDKVKKEGVQIQTRFANDLAPVSGDRIQLQQVVLNLVVNGIDAMSAVTERPRQLQITTGNIGTDQVQVTIEDTGTGLDPNTIEKIFEPFYTTKPGGMGMGLSISRSILHSHGGRLWATAKDGPGTVFHFALSRYQEEGTYAGIGGV